MFTLFIDTHFKSIVVSLYSEDKMIDNVIKNNVVSTSVDTMPLIYDFLNKNKIDKKLIKNIIVCNGPGSFTGIRVAVTIAKTMAYCLNCNIYTIDSLSLMALNNDENVYFGTRENNGVYVARFINNLLDGDIFYLKNIDFDNFVKENKVKVDEPVDYSIMMKFLSSMKKCNCFDANPLYVKNIEVLNDKKN